MTLPLLVLFSNIELAKDVKFNSTKIMFNLSLNALAAWMAICSDTSMCRHGN